MKRIHFNLYLYLFSILIFVILSSLLSTNSVIEKISLATAYMGMFLISSTLALSAIWTIQGKRVVVSNMLRRDIAILAAFVSLTHVGFGLFVHFGGRIWPYFINTENNWYVRYDAFGIVNYIGLVLSVFVLVLLLISNNRSIKKLGAKRWKRIQKWNYFIFILLVFHGALYQIIENRFYVGIVVLVLVVCSTLVLQYLGYRIKKTKHS